MQSLKRFLQIFRIFILSLILVFSLLILIINVEICRADDGITIYVGGSGSGNYSSIQDAIDNSTDEDIIFVYDGIYDGNLVINKSITLTGFDQNSTYIIGNRSLYSILIKSSYVSVSGFTVQNSSIGIFISGPSFSNNNIFQNNISKNDEGIRLYNSSNNKITQNIISDHRNNGIIIYESIENNISQNFLSNNTEAIFFGRWSNFNKLSENDIVENEFGIILEYCYNNYINMNNILNNIRGVSLIYSSQNNVSDNIFEFNDDSGIYLSYSENNVISPNSFSNNNEDIREEAQPPEIKADGFEILLIICAILIVFAILKIKN